MINKVHPSALITKWIPQQPGHTLDRSYLMYWWHNHSRADKAPECRLLSDDTSQRLHSLAPVLQSLGRGKKIFLGWISCTAGRIRAAPSSHRRWREGARARFWSRQRPGARRGSGGRGQMDFFCRGGRSRQLVQLWEQGSGRTAGCASPSSPARAAPRHGAGSPVTQRRLRRAAVPRARPCPSPSCPAARGSPAAAGENRGGTKPRGSDPWRARHFGAALI